MQLKRGLSRPLLYSIWKFQKRPLKKSQKDAEEPPDCQQSPQVGERHGEMRSKPPIERSIASDALNSQIDSKGSDEIDKRMLSYIVHHHAGGPVGINAIAAAIAEEASLLEEVTNFYPMMGFQALSQRA